MARGGPPAQVIALQRQAGNRAVALLLQRDFLEAGAAKTAFGPAFMDAHLDERLPEINALVARLPAESRQWMESLSSSTKMSLLHQVGENGIDIVKRLAQRFATKPPVRYPKPADDGACWRFLLEMAKPDTIPGDLGMLGRLPEWVAKLKQIYAQADVHALERDLEGFHRSTEEGRGHLAAVRTFAAEVEETGNTEQPQIVMSYLTRELSLWLKTLYTGAAGKLGLTDYVLLGVGSVGRDEMFPRSDVDYSVLVSVLTPKVRAVDALISLQLKEMGEPELDELSKGPPGEVAEEHLVSKRDVLLDARTLHVQGSGKQLETAYYEARSKHVGKQRQREETATILIDTQSTKFAPTSEYLKYDDKDVKKGLLRLPTFITRNLGLFYGRETAQLDVWTRVADLVEIKALSKELAARILFVVDFASTLRIKLHNLYKSEDETFRLKADVDDDYKGYVLNASEEEQFLKCKAINEDLFARSKQFAAARFVTLEMLRKGAAEEEPTSAPGTGKDRGTTVHTTKLKLADGRIAFYEEIRVDTFVVYKRVRLKGVTYLVEPSGALRDDSGQALQQPSQDNPFATA
jgi:hypothetical protein